MRVANNPGARLGEQMEAALYLNHPYGRPVIGWRQEIEKLNRRGCARVLPALLHAQQRDPGRRRRRDRRRGQDARRGDLRQGRAGDRDRAARAPAGAGAGGAAHRHARRSARHAAEPAALLSRAVLHDREAGREPKRSRCSPTFSAAARTAGSIRRWWSSKDIAVSAGAGYPGTRARRDPHVSVSGTPKPGTTLAQLEDAIDARHRRGHRQGRDRRGARALQDRLIADAVYAQDSQATLARWYGAALTTGGTVEQVQSLARPHARGDGRSRCARPRARWLDKRRSVTGYLVKDTQTEEKRS